MRNIPEAFKRATSNNQKKYIVRAVLTLADTNHTTLTLTNAELWDGSGFAMEDAVSDDNKFTALGSTIIGTARLSIKNLNEEYSIYDFTDATALIRLGIADTGENPVLIGTYTVDECSFTDGAISLTLLDNMEKLDRPYTGNPTYPATLYQIVQSACLGKVQFQPQTSANPFPHHDFQLATEFDSDGLTCREVVGMVAAIAGCYAKCTPDGKVTFGWFDYAALNSWITAYSGGTTPSSAILARMHYITSVFSQDIAVDPVTITGVRLTYEVTDNDGKKIEQVATAGQEGYVVGFEKNNVLNACTSNQITQIKNWLGTQFIGMTFRKASLSHSSNMAIEAGDVAAVWDRKGRGYPILITRTNFTAFDQQKTVSGAETPLRNNATRYSWQSKAYLEMQKQINEEKSLRMLAEEDLRNAVASASGMYYRAVTDSQTGSTIYYLHNRRELAESPVRIMFSDAGIQVTSNGTDANPTWYGFTPGGTMFMNLMAAITIAFDQAHGGVLTLGGNGNGNGILLLKDANGENIAKMNNGGLVVYKGTIQGPNITVGGTGNNPPILYIRDADGTQLANWTVNGIKMFASNGTTVIGQWNHDGIDVRSGTISGGTISGGVIKGPNITVGGENTNGVLYIRDENDLVIGTWSKNGLRMYDADQRRIGEWNHSGITVHEGTISGNVIKAGKIESNNGKVYFDLANNKIICNSMISTDEYSSSTKTEFTIGHPDGTSSSAVSAIIRKNGSTTKYLSMSDGGMSATHSLGLQALSGAVSLSATATSRWMVQASGSGYYAQIEMENGSNRVSINPNLRVGGNMYATGQISCDGTKSRIAETQNYNRRLLYCYEMPSPMFGDIGSGVLDDRGECIVEIDDVFLETLAGGTYYVFLQKMGEGDVWVSQKEPTYFIVQGTPGLAFDWEIKARQIGCEMERLEEPEEVEREEISPEALYDEEIKEMNRWMSEQEDLYETA